jgi:hypothetical protein
MDDDYQERIVNESSLNEDCGQKQVEEDDSANQSEYRDHCDDNI